jgi:hypothetical protein
MRYLSSLQTVNTIRLRHIQLYNALHIACFLADCQHNTSTSHKVVQCVTFRLFSCRLSAQYVYVTYSCTMRYISSVFLQTVSTIRLRHTQFYNALHIFCFLSDCQHNTPTSHTVVQCVTYRLFSSITQSKSRKYSRSRL